MTYAEAVARLLALRGGEHAGMRPGLERVEGLLDALGNPERRYRLVQVGGTNGKGSVALLVAAALQAAGRRVGLYTSPHLVSFRERIRVDGEPINAYLTEGSWNVKNRTACATMSVSPIAPMRAAETPHTLRRSPAKTRTRVNRKS